MALVVAIDPETEWVDHPAHAEAGGSGSPDHVKIIDSEFFDKYIVD